MSVCYSPVPDGPAPGLAAHPGPRDQALPRRGGWEMDFRDPPSPPQHCCPGKIGSWPYFRLLQPHSAAVPTDSRPPFPVQIASLRAGSHTTSHVTCLKDIGNVCAQSYILPCGCFIYLPSTCSTAVFCLLYSDLCQGHPVAQTRSQEVSPRPFFILVCHQQAPSPRTFRSHLLVCSTRAAEPRPPSLSRPPSPVTASSLRSLPLFLPLSNALSSDSRSDFLKVKVGLGSFPA